MIDPLDPYDLVLDRPQPSFGTCACGHRDTAHAYGDPDEPDADVCLAPHCHCRHFTYAHATYPPDRRTSQP